MCKVISAVNQKGGVAKTSTTVNLGIGLASKGYKVLLIDADSQSDLTASLGWKDIEFEYTIATEMAKFINEEPFNLNDAILHHSEGVDLIPSDIELASIEACLINAMSREFILKNCIADMKEKYDYIIFDCSPSLGMVTINALAASDGIVIPVATQYLPAKGMTELFRTIDRVRHRLNKDLKIYGVLLTIADMRTNMTKSTIDDIFESYSGVVKIYNSIIPVSTKVAEASSQGISIYSYAKFSPAAKAYMSFTEEVING